MYTLKIRWMRYERDHNAATSDSPQFLMVDESILFILAEQVTVQGLTKAMDDLETWESGSYFDYHVAHEEGQIQPPMRMIQVDREGKSTWYLASFAWLMGPTGQTIERLV